MTSLTKVAIIARKIIRYGIFFIIFLIIGKFVFDIGFLLYRRIFPKPPPPPTVSFGKLPKLPFVEKDKVNLTFTLETPEGSLPVLLTQAKVYFMPKLSPNLLSLDFAKQKVRALGFSGGEEEVSKSVYRFRHKENPSYLEMNIITGAFSISYDLKTDSSPLDRKPPAPEIAKSSLRSYLTSANLFPKDLGEESSHEFLKIEEGKFVTALSLSDADALKINFFRKKYDDLPSVTSEPVEGNVWFIVGGAQSRDKQILAGEYHYFPVDESKSATYPLIPSEAAWNQLTAGQAFVSSYGLNNPNDNVKIRRIYLAYYDPGTPTEFFQPVIVFEGDKGFIAYVSGVTADYYGE